MFSAKLKFSFLVTESAQHAISVEDIARYVRIFDQ